MTKRGVLPYLNVYIGGASSLIMQSKLPEMNFFTYLQEKMISKKLNDNILLSSKKRLCNVV